MSEELHDKIAAAMDDLKKIQDELQKETTNRQHLEAGLNENDITKHELDLLNEGAKVYKAVGPLLIKTDLEAAKENVSRRIDYISRELSQIDDRISQLEDKEEEHVEVLQQLNQELQLDRTTDDSSYH